MTVHPMKNPMYALCLLAAVCVRQHVQNRSSEPLTKGVSFQAPTTLLTKPNEANLRTVINAQNTKLNSQKLPSLQEVDSLVSCVYKFANRARRMVDDIRISFPISKSSGCLDPTSTCGIFDSILYLTSSVGTKWLT